MRNVSKKYSMIFAVVFIFLILAYPTVSSAGITKGLIVSAKVIIPSLFPFTVCVLMILKTGISIKNEKINFFLNKYLGQNFNMIFVYLMSLIGGYPIGARLINELYKEKIIDKKVCNIMVSYCVNAGPSFIISTVSTVFSSTKIAVVVLVSHISASIVLALFGMHRLKIYGYKPKSSKIKTKYFSEIFVESVADASTAMIGICSFVILFSSINSFFDYFFCKVPIIKYISYFTEISTAIMRTKNVYIIAFLLGISGISIWCQIFAMTSSFKINFVSFILCRILHGVISVIVLYFLVSVLKIKLYTFSNNENFSFGMTYSGIFLFFSMLVLFIVFLISVYSKNNSGKILDDVI